MRLTLRDLLWLVAVIALPLAWWIDHRQMAARQVWLGNALGAVYERAITGHTLQEVVKDHKLDSAPSWVMPNTPPGEDSEVTYYLDDGDLTLRFSGDPAVVHEARFDFSDKSVKDRYSAAAGSWSEWVERHSK